MQLCELTSHIPASPPTSNPKTGTWGWGDKHQATKGPRTHIGPSFCGGLDDAEQLGGGDRAGGGGGHLGILRGSGRLLRRHCHDGARLAGPGAKHGEAEGPRRRRVLGGILGEEGRGGGGGSEKIPCHWCSEKGFDALLVSESELFVRGYELCAPINLQSYLDFYTFLEN